MWVHHHSMAHPRVGDRGKSLQIRSVAANTFNKQSQTADTGWPSAWGLGRMLTTPHHTKPACYKSYKELQT